MVQFRYAPGHYVHCSFIRIRLRNGVVGPIHTAKMFARRGGELYSYLAFMSRVLLEYAYLLPMDHLFRT